MDLMSIYRVSMWVKRRKFSRDQDACVRRSACESPLTACAPPLLDVVVDLILTIVCKLHDKVYKMAPWYS